MSPAELARQVRLLEIATRHLVTDVFAGDYSSAFKGRGMEFADVREYQPGDDVRTIDWNVTARAGRPFIKRFSEERELTVMLAVDLSGSGGFGTGVPLERELACEVAALLAFAAVRKGDRVGLLIFTDRVEMYVPPKKGARHTLRLIRELLAFEPTHMGTRLTAAADHICRLLPRRSLVFVVSDFLSDDMTSAMRKLAPRHDLVALDVGDPRDIELVAAGLLDVKDPETGRTMVLDTTSRRVREAYAAIARRAGEEREQGLRRLGIDHLGLSTDKASVHELVEFFKMRERRRSR